MKENGDMPGHSNRIFCVRFDPLNSNMLASVGWDNTVQIYDIRKKGTVGSIYGPHICGDAIDYFNDGFTLLTGSYRQDNVLELWDLRKLKKFRDIEWDGPKASSLVAGNAGMEDEEAEQENQSPGNSPTKEGEPAQTEGYSGDYQAPFIYSCQFSKNFDTIMAAGAGCNQVRLFDFETGNILC